MTAFSASMATYLEARASAYRDIGWSDLADMLQVEAAVARRMGRALTNREFDPDDYQHTADTPEMVGGVLAASSDV